MWGLGGYDHLLGDDAHRAGNSNSMWGLGRHDHLLGDDAHRALHRVTEHVDVSLGQKNQTTPTVVTKAALYKHTKPTVSRSTNGMTKKNITTVIGGMLAKPSNTGSQGPPQISTIHAVRTDSANVSHQQIRVRANPYLYAIGVPLLHMEVGGGEVVTQVSYLSCVQE